MKVFIGNYTGICNHLESVVLAFAIRERFGHEIWLDWPELDAFSIQSTRVGGRRLHHRLNTVKYRGASPDEFERLRADRHIDLRGYLGAPEALLDAQLPQVVRSLKLAPELARRIREFFAGIAAPVVGVHIRRGDFVVDPDPHRRHRATSDEDLMFSMERIQRGAPDAVFFLSYTGRAEDYRFLSDRFRCVSLPIPSPYSHHGPTQASEKHPIADLFALACCTQIVVTPRSSYSHWAANCLGAPSLGIAPVRTAGGRAALSVSRLGRCRLPHYMQEPWKPTPDPLPAPTRAHTEWL